MSEKSENHNSLHAMLWVVAKDVSIFKPVVSELNVNGVDVQTYKLTIPGDSQNCCCHFFRTNSDWYFARVEDTTVKLTKLETRSPLAALDIVFNIGKTVAKAVKAGRTPDLSSAAVSFTWCLNVLRANTGLFGGWARDFRLHAKELSEKLEEKSLLF